MEKWDLGYLAYVGYATATNGKTYDGRSMPSWLDLPPSVREAWRAAADCVKMHLESGALPDGAQEVL